MSSPARPTMAASAAFPTAKVVAAMRAVDAAGDRLIGSNIGAGPDVLAEALAGPEGIAMLEESAAEAHLPARSLATLLISRTLLLDSLWASARSSGVCQFVILAAGLDARAWRMPDLDSKVTIFEIDVAEAHAFKTARLTDAGVLPPRCRRVALNADLRDASWPASLEEAGFYRTRPSFFLVEGLLTYLPVDAPARLLGVCAGLMAPGSSIAGDAFVGPGMLSSQSESVKKWGTRWIFSYASAPAAVAMLQAAGLQAARALPYHSVNLYGSAHTAAAAVDAVVAFKADALRYALGIVAAWSPGARALAVATVASPSSGAPPPVGDADVLGLAHAVIDAEGDLLGLQAAPAEARARVIEAALADGFPARVRGLVDRVRSAPAQLEEEAPERETSGFLTHLVFHAEKQHA